MRNIFHEILGLLLFGGAFIFLFKAVSFLASREYFAAIIATLIGIAVIRTASSLVRLSLIATWRGEGGKKENDQ